MPDRTTAQAETLTALLRRLTWAIPLLALTVLMASVSSFYLLQTRPAADRYARQLQAQTSQQVVNHITNLVDQSERVLLTVRDWSQAGLLPIDNPVAINRLLAPVLQQRATISSAHVAHEHGQEVLLLKTDSKGWKNRLTDVPRQGIKQRWLIWSDDPAKFSEETKEQDYDPRKRPWFAGAMATPPGQLHWTAPYIFQTTGEPGISVALRWLDAQGQSNVVALDIRLIDLSRFTHKLEHAEHGYAALLTEDGKVLGLPRHPLFRDESDLKKSVLQAPDKIGLPALAEAWRQWQTQGQPSGAMRLLSEDQQWLAALHRLQVRNVTFTAATLAPESDFSPLSTQLSLVLTGLFLVAGIVALGMAQRLNAGIARPISRLFDELASSNQRLASEASSKAAISQLAPRLQAADSLEALGHTLLSDFAQRLGIGQGSLYRYQPATQQLRLVCSHAGTAQLNPPAAIALGEGLLGTCAQHGQAIELQAVPSDYLRIASGLIDTPPVALLLLPVQRNGALLGILELAALAPLDAAARQHIDELLPMLAMCMEILERMAEVPKMKDLS